MLEKQCASQRSQPTHARGDASGGSDLTRREGLWILGMRTKSLLLAGLLVLLFVGLAASPASAHHCKGKHKGDPGCEPDGDETQDTLVCVDFVDATNAIQSDFLGPYCSNKQTKVYAHIGRQSGQFRLRTTTSIKKVPSSARKNFLTFGDCLEVIDCNAPVTFPVMVFSPTDFNTWRNTLDLREMAIFEQGTAPMRVIFTDDGTADGKLYWLNFGEYNPSDPIVCDGDEVLVTRTGAETWTIESSPLDKGACLDEVEPKDRFSLSQSHYDVPFYLEITVLD